jgi:hypothetical protein
MQLSFGPSFGPLVFGLLSLVFGLLSLVVRPLVLGPWSRGLRVRVKFRNRVRVRVRG